MPSGTCVTSTNQSAERLLETNLVLVISILIKSTSFSTVLDVETWTLAFINTLRLWRMVFISSVTPCHHILQRVSLFYQSGHLMQTSTRLTEQCTWPTINSLPTKHLLWQTELAFSRTSFILKPLGTSLTTHIKTGLLASTSQLRWAN